MVAFLTHVDPMENMNRWYEVSVQPTLIDKVAVIRRWGSRETAMQQMAKGIVDETIIEKALASLKRIKYRLWHGNVETPLLAIGTLQDLCYDIDDENVILKYKQLHKTAEAFDTYIWNNAAFIPNYVERHCYGELISIRNSL